MNDEWKRGLTRMNELYNHVCTKHAASAVDRFGKPVEGRSPTGERILVQAIVATESSAATLLLGPNSQAILAVPGQEGAILMDDVRDWLEWCGGREALDALLDCMNQQSFPGSERFGLAVMVVPHGVKRATADEHASN